MWRLAWPMILANLTVPLLGAVDTAVVGHLPGPHFLGALAVGALIFNVIYWGFGFLRMGTTGFAAQAFGAGEAAELTGTLVRPLGLAALLAAVLLLLQAPILSLALTLIGPGAEVGQLAGRYFEIRIWGAPAALANYVVLGFLLGVQRVRAALVLQVVIHSVNIALDLLFVPVLGWGVPGVAAATLIAEWTGAGLGLPLAGRALTASTAAWAAILDLKRLGRLVVANRDIFVRTLCLQAAFAFFTAQGARLGVTILAANAVLLNFQSFLAYGLDGFAHAAEALVGSAVGARNRAALDGAVRASTRWALMVGGGITVLFGALGWLLIRVLTDVEDVRATALDYLVWVVLSPLVSVWSFQLDGIFIGAIRTAEMRNAMIASLAVFIAAALTLVPLLGNHGLWLAFLVFMAARAMTLGLRYPRLAAAVGP
ncbi:MAG: MATE family efflux transporter [Alphaproteobacteria bacterium]